MTELKSLASGARIIRDGKDVLPAALAVGASCVRIIRGENSGRYYVQVWTRDDFTGHMLWNGALPSGFASYYGAQVAARPFIVAKAVEWLDDNHNIAENAEVARNYLRENLADDLADAIFAVRGF